MRAIFQEKILFIGMGKFGTAIAYRLNVTEKYKIIFHTRDAEAAMKFNETGINPRCFEECKFEESLAISSFEELDKLKISTIFITVDSKSIVETAYKLKPHISKKVNIVVASKGICLDEPFFYSKIVQNILGEKASVYYFSGPNFADEIIKGDLSITTIAGSVFKKTKSIANLFKTTNIKIEITTDVIGVQLFGAMKNVMAITVGILEGLEYGKNRIIRTLMNFVSEIQALSRDYDAKESSAYLAAGIGDIMLTCFDMKSRNKKFGVEIGKNGGIKNVSKDYLVEGYYAINSIRKLAQKHKVKSANLNYINAIYDILYNSTDPLTSLNQAESLSKDVKIPFKRKIVHFFHAIWYKISSNIKFLAKSLIFWRK